MDDGKRRSAFDDMKADSRKAARETLGLVAAMKNAPRKKSALVFSSGEVTASSPPPPGAMPALPPGFALER
jgi:hypothetical protein